jgi:hypothetical protein
MFFCKENFNSDDQQLHQYRQTHKHPWGDCGFVFSEFICEVVVGLCSVSLDVRWLWVCRYWWSCWSSLLKFSLQKNICLVWGLGLSVFLYYRELKKSLWAINIWKAIISSKIEYVILSTCKDYCWIKLNTNELYWIKSNADDSFILLRVQQRSLINNGLSVSSDILIVCHFVNVSNTPISFVLKMLFSSAR